MRRFRSGERLPCVKNCTSHAGLSCQAWVGGYQPAGSPEPAGNWSWVSGETWGYSNWGAGQPNNDWYGTEHNLCFYIKTTVFGNLGQWGDAREIESMYYIVEYVPEPGSGLLVLLGAALAVYRRLR